MVESIAKATVKETRGFSCLVRCALFAVFLLFTIHGGKAHATGLVAFEAGRLTDASESSARLWNEFRVSYSHPALMRLNTQLRVGASSILSEERRFSGDFDLGFRLMGTDRVFLEPFSRISRAPMRNLDAWSMMLGARFTLFLNALELESELSFTPVNVSEKRRLDFAVRLLFALDRDDFVYDFAGLSLIFAELYEGRGDLQRTQRANAVSFSMGRRF